MDVVNGPPILGLLKFLTGPMAGNSYQITKPTMSLGREPGNDITISDPSVSRHHAQITWNNGTWSIQKLTPQNTLLVNQRDVQQSPIKDRDTIALGTGTTFLFQVNSSVQRSPAPPAPQGTSQQSQIASPPPKVVLPASPQPYIPGAAAPPPAEGGTQRAPTRSRPDSTDQAGVPTLEISSNQTGYEYRARAL